MDNGFVSSTHKEILIESAEQACVRVAGFIHWTPRLFWLRLISWFTLLCFLGQPVVTLANIIAAPTTPLTTVNTTAQGRELVNINTTNQNGVSFNQYQQFDVNKNGAVLNNNNGGPQANQNVPLQQGSYANGGFTADHAAANPNLGQRHAQLILNQVTSTNPSQLNGPLEVAGQKADVIIANPNGITCNGCGFINTTRGVLTTGQLNDNGGTGWGVGGNSQLSNIAVAQGKITIASGGLVDYETPQIDIIARGISIQGQIRGQQGGHPGDNPKDNPGPMDAKAIAVNQLNLIAGENTIRLTGPTGTMGISHITAIQPYSNTNRSQDLEIINTNSNTATDYIDVGRLGGMYAHEIFLASTSKGVGVNSAGTIYSINDVLIAANGMVHLGVAGTNSDGSTGHGSVESGYYTDINHTNTNDLRGSGSITIVGATRVTQTADDLYAADTVDNRNGTLRAHGGDIFIRAANFDNTAGTVSATGGNDALGNVVGGALDIMTNGLVINEQGSLQANSDILTIDASGIDNTLGGIIYTASDMSLTTGAAGINNSAVNGNPAGLINADRKIELNTTGALLNSGSGTIQAKQNVLNVTANNIDNSNGGVLKSGTDIRLTAIAGDIDNRQGGLINAGNGSNAGGGYIQLYAKQGLLRNSHGGQIKSDKDYLSIEAAGIDNSARGILRALQDIDITAQQYDIDNRFGGIIDTSGQVTLTAAQGDLLNAAGSVQSRQGLTILSQNIDNSAGLLQDIDKGNLDITTGVLKNLAGNYTAADGSVSVGGKISSQKGTIVNLSTTDLTNSGVINSGNTDPYASAALITISGNFTNSGLIQGRQDLEIDFNQSPSQVNSGTITSSRDLIIKNASSFTNLGQADATGHCGGLCAGNDLIMTGGQIVNNGMMRALGNIYLGFDPTDSTANTAGLSRLENLLGAAIIAVKGSVKARVNGADFSPAANGQGVDPAVLQNAQTALTNAQTAQNAANAALQNVKSLVGNLNTLKITADNLNDVQGGSLTAVLERGKADSLRLQNTATSLNNEANDASLNNSSLSTGTISAANSADTTARQIYTQTGTTMVQTGTDAQGNPIMSSRAVGTGKIPDAESALSDARGFFGWGSNAFTDVVAPSNSAPNAPVPKLSDYITQLTNLKNAPNTPATAKGDLYQAAGCTIVTSTCDQKIQTLINSLNALQTANQNVTTQINSGTTTVSQLITAGTADIATKKTTVTAAALTTAQAQAAVTAITGPVANSQALQNAQNDVDAKQAAVDQINNNNASLVQQAATDQAALAVANANKIDAAKALANAQNLQNDLSTLSSTAGGVAAINGSGSITDNALAVQDRASLMLKASNRIALEASDPSLTGTSLKSAATALATSANQNASNSSAAANALLAKLDHSFALADQTPVNNLNTTNQNANALVASINTRLQSLSDYIKTVQGQPQAAALQTVATKLVALRDAAGTLATAASDPVPPAASSSTPADPPPTATQKASATQHAVDDLKAAAQDVNSSLSTLSAFTVNDPANISALLIDSNNFVNTAKNDASNSKNAKATLVSAIDTQFRADPVNQALIQQMISASQAAAGDQTTANNLNSSAASQVNLKQTANTQAIAAQAAAQTTADNSAAQVDAIQNQLITANNDLVNSVVAMSKVAGASAMVTGQPAIHNLGIIYAGKDITLAVNPNQGEKATIFNESHQDAAGNQDGGLIQAGRSMSLGRDCGLDANGLCTKTVWNNTNGASAGIVEVNNTAAIRTTGVNSDSIAWGSGGDINIQAEIFHNSIVDPGVTNNEGAHTRVYEGDSGRYGQGIDPLVHLRTHGGYVMGNTPSGNNSVDIQNAQTNTANYASAVAGATAALVSATAACIALVLFCAGVPIAAAGLVTAQLSYTGAFYKDFTETWTTTQSFNTPLSKARPNITAAHNLVIRELNGTNIGGTLAAGNNVTITPIDGIAGKGTFINKALVLQKFDYTLYGRTESKCGMGDTACTGGPIQTLGDVLDPLGAPVTSTLVINGIQQSYGGIIQALNGTAGITVGTLINIGATDPNGNAPDTGRAGLSVTASTKGAAAQIDTKDNASVDSGHGAISQVARGGFFADFSLPKGNNGLFILARANSPYLVVSNPLYGSNNNTPGADTLYRDYYKPANDSLLYQQKIIGDARYQAKLIQDQLLAETGLASLGSSVYGPDMLEEMTRNSFSQNDALIQNGKSGFTVGQALTPEQQAGLTQDIVWLVSQNIGGQMVLVPQMYLSPATKAKIAGGQILGKNVDIQVTRLYNIGGGIQTNDMVRLAAQGGNTADNAAPGKLTINASKNILNASGTINGNELNITADTLYNTTLIKRAGDQNNYQDIASNTGLIQGGTGGATITTTHDLNNFGGQINAQGGDVNVTSTEGNINIRSLVLEKKETHTSVSGDLFNHSEHIDIKTKQTALSGGISATKASDGTGGNITLSGQTGINLTGGAIKGDADVTLLSEKGSVNDRALYLTDTSFSKDSSTSFGANITPNSFNFSYGTDTKTKDTLDKTGSASTIQAGKGLTIKAKNIISEGGIYSGQTGDLETNDLGVIAFKAIKNEHHETTSTTSNRISFSGSVAGATAAPGSTASKTAAPDEVASLKAGFQHKDSTTTIDQVNHENALLAFKNGVTIKADNKNNVAPDQVSGAGQSILDLGGLDIYSGGNVNAQAGRVISTKYVNTYSEKTKTNELFVGVDADLHSSLMTTIKDAQAQIPEPTKAEIAKYKAKNPGKTDDDAKNAIKAEYEKQKEGKLLGDAVAKVFKGLGGVKAGVGFEGTSSETSVTATSENISRIAGANINITASQGNMTLAGVDLSATGQTYQRDTSNKFVDSNGNPKKGYKRDADGNIVTAQGRLVADKNGYLLDAKGNRLLQGGDINLQSAQGDIDIIAARTTLSASSNSTSYGANIGVGIDINPAEMLLSQMPGVGTVMKALLPGSFTRAGFHVGNDKSNSDSVGHIDSSLAASGILTINSSKRNINLTGVTAIGSDVKIGAGGDINSNAYQDSESHSASSAYVGFSNSLAGGPPTRIKGSDKKGDSTQQVGNTIYALGSTTTNIKGKQQHVDGTLSMVSNLGNITMIGGDYYGDNANINATQGDVKFIAAKSTSHEESSSGGVQLSMGASASFAGFGAGVDYGSLDGGRAEYTVPDALQDQVKNYSSSSVQSSGVANAEGPSLSIAQRSESQAKKMAALQAAGLAEQLESDNSAATLANNAFASGSTQMSDTLRKQAVIAQNSAGSVNEKGQSKSNSGELIGAHSGLGIDINIEKTSSTEYSNTQLNVGKKLTIAAGKGSVDIGGVDIGNIDPSGESHSGTQINISAEEILSTKYVNTSTSESHSDSAFIGMKAEGHSAIADAAAHATTHVINAVKGKDYKGKDGGGLSASDYAKGRFAAETTIEVANDAMNLVTGDLIGGSVTMNIGDTHTWQKSSSTQENINTITGGSITLQSTRRDITLNGVNIAADDQVTLDSARDINVRAAKSTSNAESNTTSVNLSGGGGAGVNAVALATTGDIGPNASAGLQASNTYSRSKTTSYENASITAGNQVTLKSKRDTNLTGANVESKKVDLEIGGNLNITSLQDTQESQAIDVNVNLSSGASVSAYTLVSPTVGVGGGGGEHHDNYAKVKKQAGIKASEGISGNVAGDISLTGAHIEDQSGQSTLGVGGNIYATQLKDFQDKDGGTGGLNVTIGENSQKTGKSVQGIGYTFTTDEAIHYEATQNATIAGVKLQKTWTSTDANGNTVINQDKTNVIRALENVNTDANNKTTVTRDDYVQAFATGADPLDFVKSVKDIGTHIKNKKTKTPVVENGSPDYPSAGHDYDSPPPLAKKPPPEHPDVELASNPPKKVAPPEAPGLTHTPPENPKPAKVTPEVTHNEPEPPAPIAPPPEVTIPKAKKGDSNAVYISEAKGKQLNDQFSGMQGKTTDAAKATKALLNDPTMSDLKIQADAADATIKDANNLINKATTSAEKAKIPALKQQVAEATRAKAAVELNANRRDNPQQIGLRQNGQDTAVTLRANAKVGDQLNGKTVATIDSNGTSYDAKGNILGIADVRQLDGKLLSTTPSTEQSGFPSLAQLKAKNGDANVVGGNQYAEYKLSYDPSGHISVKTEVPTSAAAVKAAQADKQAVINHIASTEGSDAAEQASKLLQPTGTSVVPQATGTYYDANGKPIDFSNPSTQRALRGNNKVTYVDEAGNTFSAKMEIKTNSDGSTGFAPKDAKLIKAADNSASQAEMTHNISIPLPTGGDSQSYAIGGKKLDLSQMNPGDTVSLDNGLSAKVGKNQNGDKTLSFENLTPAQMNTLNKTSIDQFNANGQHIATDVLSVAGAGTKQAGLTSDTTVHPPSADQAQTTITGDRTANTYRINGQDVDTSTAQGRAALLDALKNNPDTVTLKAGDTEHKVVGVKQAQGQGGKSTNYQPVLEPVKADPNTGTLTIAFKPDQNGKVANYTDEAGQPLNGIKTKAELDTMVTKDGETPKKIFTNEKGEQAILKLVPDPNDATKQIPKLEHYDPTPPVATNTQSDGTHTFTFNSNLDGYHYGDATGNNKIKLSDSEMNDYLGTGKTKTVDVLDKNGQPTGAKAELSFEKDPGDPNKIVVNSKLDNKGVELTTQKPVIPKGTAYTLTDGQGNPIVEKSGGVFAKLKSLLTKGSGKDMSFSTEGMTKKQTAQLKEMLDKGQEVVVTRPNPEGPSGEPLKFSVQIGKDADGKEVLKLTPKQTTIPADPTAPATPTSPSNSITPEGSTSSNGNTPTVDVPVDRLALVKNAAPESALSNENTSTADTPVDQQVLVKENQYIQPPKAGPPEHIPSAPVDSVAATAFYNDLKTKPLERVVINANDQNALDALKANSNVLQVTADDGTILYTNYDNIVAGIPKNKAVFWSDASRTDPQQMSGQDVARQYAQNHNRASLEMMIDQSGIKVPNIADIPPPYPPLIEELKIKGLQPGTPDYQKAIKDAYKTASGIQTRQKAFEKMEKGETLLPAEQEAFKKGRPSEKEIQDMKLYQQAADDPVYKEKREKVDAFWGGISEALAKSVKGNVYALLSKDVINRALDPNNPREKDKSVFISREIEALKNNPEVNRIIASDPNTYEQFVLFDRTTELSLKRDTLEEQLKTTNDETQANKLKEEINQVKQKLQTLLETNVDFKRYAQEREFVIDEGNQLIPYTKEKERMAELVQKRMVLQKVLDKLNANKNANTPQNSELKENINRVINVIDQKLQKPEKPINGPSSQSIKNPAPESTQAVTSLIEDTPLAQRMLADNETSQKEIAKNPCPLCFAAGTLVSTPKGYRAIEKLKVGDIVWTKRENNIGLPFAGLCCITKS